MQKPAAEIIGPLTIRRFQLNHVCESHVGHEHEYDHDTIVIRGRVQVTENGVLHTHTYGPGAVIFIAAGRSHTIKALEPSEYLCVFSHRDFDGRVSQRYLGHPLEAEHAGAPAPQQMSLSL